MRVWLTAAGLAALGLWAWTSGAGPASVPVAGTGAGALMAPMPLATSSLTAPPSPQASTVSLADTPASLHGTEADGGLHADAQGRLVVERGVRRRLDYWLSAVGEWQPDEIGARLLASAQRELPPTALAQLRVVWVGYLALQRHAWQRAAVPADPSTWRAALEERQAVRRQRLGRDWADAFYAEEEQALWGEILAWESGRAATPATQAPLLPEHPQAAQRVAEVEAQWAQWERRLDGARAEMARLRAAPELSELQREQAAQAWLSQRFSGSEQLRVRALLGLAANAGA